MPNATPNAHTAHEVVSLQVVQSAKACLKMNGKFCGFSPCIEQVQRTAGALRQAEFCDVRCIECILRYHDVRTENYALPVNACSLLSAASNGPGDTSAHKRTATEAGIEPDDPAAAVNADSGDPAAGQRQGSEQNGERTAGAGPAREKKGDVPGRVKERRLGRHRPLYVPWMSEHESVRRTVTMPRHVARGHTGYLLFARKPVRVSTEDGSGNEADKDAPAPAHCEHKEDAAKEEKQN